MLQRQGARIFRNEAYFFVGRRDYRMKRNAAYGHFTKSLEEIFQQLLQ